VDGTHHPLLLTTVALILLPSSAVGRNPVHMEDLMTPTMTMTQHGTTPESRADEPRMPVEVSGTGPRLVLVGGGLTGWASWAPHAERLSGSRTVARLQPLNVAFGLLDRPLPEDYSVGMESQAMAAAIDSLGWTDPLDIVAWSYGALVSLAFALDQPARVRTLTLIEPPAVWLLPGRGDNDPDVAALRSLSTHVRGEIGERELVEFLQVAALVPPGTTPQELPQWPVWYAHRRSLRSGNAPLDYHGDPARLGAFPKPVLLVTGTGTSPFLRGIHEALAAALPDARTLELPAGHAPHLVSMDRFLTELATFQSGAE
jgi:pimeloyl-ACP methyl ester carboxylesterase